MLTNEELPAQLRPKLRAHLVGHLRPLRAARRDVPRPATGGQLGPVVRLAGASTDAERRAQPARCLGLRLRKSGSQGSGTELVGQWVLTDAEQTASVDKAIWNKGQTDEVQLKQLLDDQHRWTGSKRARELLDNWDTARSKFVKVFPTEYKRALGEMAAVSSKTSAKNTDKKAPQPA